MGSHPLVRSRRGADGGRFVTGLQGGALNRNHVNHYVWKQALRAVAPLRSVLLDAGESIKAVSQAVDAACACYTSATSEPGESLDARSDVP
jgi:hypothetical protein